MKLLDTETTDWVPLWRRIPVVLWVVLALLVLLHGPTGAGKAILAQAWGLVATMLGGDQVVVAVLCQTAPLALAMAVIVFCWLREWITFESMWSVVTCAVVLICGASIGAELRGFLERVLPESQVHVANNLTTEQPTGPITLAWLNQRTNQETNRVSAQDAFKAMTTWSYVSALGASETWPDRVPRVALLPEKGSWLVVVGRGVNQLLGYIVFYRPRMFLAALIVGSYFGWAWHRRLEWAHEKVMALSFERSRGRRAA